MGSVIELTSPKGIVRSDIARRSMAATPVLLASCRSEDTQSIPALLPREHWMLIKVATWPDVLRLIGTVIIPVMLCDREIPGLNWPVGLDGLRQCPSPPALVLLSDLDAGSLWDDVISYGGFDMLFRPLCQQWLVAALDLARTHWEMGLERPAEPTVEVGP
jgi:hypothetical protein